MVTKIIKERITNKKGGVNMSETNKSERIELVCVRCERPYTLNKSYYEKFRTEYETKICSLCEAELNSNAWDD